MNSACLRENPSLLQRAKVAYDVAAEKEQAKPGKGKGKGKGDGKSDKGARVRRTVLQASVIELLHGCRQSAMG